MPTKQQRQISGQYGERVPKDAIVLPSLDNGQDGQYWLDPKAVAKAQYMALIKQRDAAKKAQFEFNPDQPRDDHGRWTDAGGNPTSDVTQTTGFKNWFGGSKVVDNNGKPLVVYHGTTAGDFKEFKPGLGGRIWFAADPAYSDSYTQQTGSMLPLYVKLENPKIFDATPNGRLAWAQTFRKNGVLEDDNVLRKEGHDGVLFAKPDGSINDGYVFKPEQIKSKFNSGAFNPKDKRISFEQPEYYRALTKYEKRVDFAKIDSALVRLANTTNVKLRDILRGVQKAAIKRVTDMINAGLTPQAVGLFRINTGPDFNTTFKNFLTNAWREGRDQSYSELPPEIQKQIQIIKAFEWDEEKHPRDEIGRWTDAGGNSANKQIVDDKNVAEFKTILKKEIGDNPENYLLHGTTAKNAKSIKKNGIVPQVGNFVRDAYEEEYRAAGIDFNSIAEPLAFFAPASDTTERAGGGGAMTAMQHHVAALLNKNFHDVTEADIREHGALIVVNRDSGDFTDIKQEDKNNGAYPDSWVGVEPGDVVSESVVPAEKIIRGNALVNLWRPWQRTFAFQEGGRHLKRYAYLFEWNEADHPREPAGSPEGGQFTSGDSGGAVEKPLETYLTRDQVEPYISWNKEAGFQIKGKPGAWWKGAILSPDQVPETLYHVTTAKDAVDKSGYLLGQNEGGGMGGGNGLAGVSLTSSKDTAEFIARELTRTATIAQTVRSPADYAGLLDRYVDQDYKLGGGNNPKLLKVLVDAKNEALRNFDVNAADLVRLKSEGSKYVTGNPYAQAAAENYRIVYLNMRSKLEYDLPKGEERNTYPLRNPYLMGGSEAQMKLTPDQIGIVTVKRDMIPKNALVRNGTDDFLQEIRVHADIPLRPDVNTKKHGDGQYFIEYDAEWNEEDHPRDEAGRFADKEGGGGFFSPLEKSLDTAKQKIAPASNWTSIISKMPGVTKDELNATGVMDFLKSKGNAQVTKDELLAFVKENGVQITPVTLGTPSDAMNEERTRLDNEWFANSERMRQSTDPQEILALHKRNDEIVQREKEISNLPLPKFSQYTLPGGENYRELLLTLPVKQELPPGFEVKQVGTAWSVTFPNGTTLGGWPTREAAIASQAKQDNSPYFTSAHFDQPNIVAHVRMDDRTDAEGNKILFVEEIQSDWAQKGRETGFIGDKPAFTELPSDYQIKSKKEEGDANITRYWIEDANGNRVTADSYNLEGAVNNAINDLNDRARGTTASPVPSAPFVTDTKAWVGLAMKNVIQEAVKGGYSGVAWTTGEQQAARYNLSKAVDKIQWNSSGNTTYMLLKGVKGISNRDLEIGITKDTGKIRVTDIGAPDWEGKHLSEVVGKDIASKILSSNDGEIKGEGLKVGGEGMKSFYDGIVPQVAQSLIKRQGGGELQRIKTVFKELAAPSSKSTTHEQQGFYITPKMRESVKNGLSLFESEQDAFKVFAGFDPRQAIDYLTTKALIIQGLLDNELTEDVRQILLEHLKGGRTLTESIMDLRDTFEPWVGDPEKIAPSGQVGIGFPPGTMAPENVLMAYRLENMVRTPLIEAYNQGILAVGDATNDYVIGYQYSAILDKRTCLRENSLIKLANGKYRKIAEMRPGDKIVSGTGAKQTVVACWRYPAERWIKLTLDDGREVTCTSTHRWWTKHGWTEAVDITASETDIGTESWNRIELDQLSSLWPNDEAVQQQSAQVLLKPMLSRMAENLPDENADMSGMRYANSASRRNSSKILFSKVPFRKSNDSKEMRSLREPVQDRQIERKTRTRKILHSRLLSSRQAQSSQQDMSAVRSDIFGSGKQCGPISGLLAEVQADVSAARRSGEIDQSCVQTLQETISNLIETDGSEQSAAEILLPEMPTSILAIAENAQGVLALRQDHVRRQNADAHILFKEVLASFETTDTHRDNGGKSSDGAFDSVHKRISGRSLLDRLLSLAEQDSPRDRRSVLAFSQAERGCEEGRISENERHRAGEIPLQEAHKSGRRFTASHADHENEPTAADFVRVLKVEEFDELAWAYDLEVENDHSYIANGLISHNTEICRENDGLMIKADDPRLRKLTPPVHFQCRSLLVYVTVDDAPVDWSSDDELDAAVERVQDGFA